MARLISWLLAKLSARQLRRLVLGLVVGEICVLAALIALAGSLQAALYIVAAALVVLFIGIWRERLLHSK